MPQANINDRASLERLYPPDRFRQDAGRNGVATASVLHGLRIMSQPDADGAFELAIVKRQSGERDPEGDSVFVPPYLTSQAATAPTRGSGYAGQEAAGAAPGATGQADADYAAFIDRVLSLARSVEFKTASGQDPRLRGFHGG